MLRCAGCQAALPTVPALLMSTRDWPLACGVCGRHQYMPAMRWRALVLFAVLAGVLAYAAEIVLRVEGKDVWAVAMAAALVTERVMAYRHGRMRSWTESRLRDWALFAFSVAFAAVFAAAALASILWRPASVAEGPLARVEGAIEYVSDDCDFGCECLRLVGHADRFTLNVPEARRLLGTPLPADLQPGAQVVMQVPASDLTTAGRRRIVGLKIGDRELLSSRDVVRSQRAQWKANAILLTATSLFILFAGLFGFWRRRRFARRVAALATRTP